MEKKQKKHDGMDLCLVVYQYQDGTLMNGALKIISGEGKVNNINDQLSLMCPSQYVP